MPKFVWPTFLAVEASGWAGEVALVLEEMRDASRAALDAEYGIGIAPEETG